MNNNNKRSFYNLYLNETNKRTKISHNNDRIIQKYYVNNKKLQLSNDAISKINNSIYKISRYNYDEYLNQYLRMFYYAIKYKRLKIVQILIQNNNINWYISDINNCSNYYCCIEKWMNLIIDLVFEDYKRLKFKSLYTLYITDTMRFLLFTLHVTNATRKDMFISFIKQMFMQENDDIIISQALHHILLYSSKLGNRYSDFSIKGLIIREIYVLNNPLLFKYVDGIDYHYSYYYKITGTMDGKHLDLLSQLIIQYKGTGDLEDTRLLQYLFSCCYSNEYIPIFKLIIDQLKNKEEIRSLILYCIPICIQSQSYELCDFILDSYISQYSFFKLVDYLSTCWFNQNMVNIYNYIFFIKKIKIDIDKFEKEFTDTNLDNPYYLCARLYILNSYSNENQFNFYRYNAVLLSQPKISASIYHQCIIRFTHLIPEIQSLIEINILPEYMKSLMINKNTKTITLSLYLEFYNFWKHRCLFYINESISINNLCTIVFEYMD